MNKITPKQQSSNRLAAKAFKLSHKHKSKLTKNKLHKKRKFSTTTASKSETSEPKAKTLADFPQSGGPGSLFRQNFYYVSKSIFTHGGYNKEDMAKIAPHHRTPVTFGDRWASNALKLIRGGFDLVTGYTHPPKGEEYNPKYKMSTEQWMVRFIFLESIAGVPGFAGGMIRHLQSLRLLKRDNGWIETLLDESYNERMHLLSFLEAHKPGPFMKLMIMGAQGVFFNCFFLTYLVAPKMCHRFVGGLEEEAVVTYTRAINEIEHGFYPEWERLEAPSIAKAYWKMPEKSTFKDMLYYIRADEAQHCEVNHTLANLIQNADPNPYSMQYNHDPHPTTKDLTSVLSHPVGWERGEIEVDAAMNPDAPIAQAGAFKY